MTIRRLGPIFLMVIGLGFLFVSPAFSADNKPGCHGHNEKDCRPDPNEHGKDCDQHGRNHGGNDDHCATTTTEAPTTTTTGVVPPVTVPTNPTTTTTEPPLVLPTTTTAPPETTTTLAPPAVTTTTTMTAVPAPVHEDKLPFTGTRSDLEILAGLGLCVSGAALRVAGTDTR